ncbi:hypothetical protein YH66_09720 [[Brevibacterium] flavum]|uniref:Uncharacterized protein n=1 Tax=[Brevibacterium] flavum TaxID=92706 RepID=A0A0F6Z651_9CORY|nr:MULTISPECIES: hypothetical protein [Corynebacterium]AKF27808.1 hypothetical protein YH66_09720 [[Brevibacterium] flavum]ANE08640.1 hypothetical protein A3654_09780 [Corynebacterium glutamicum]AST21053.1 hypothetical protein CEY17_09860 [Corynebacterium glutamicum ATCC 14067]KEI23562.1 hypothetical protein KIQ_013630 [Corynebacterium glutamicum ATCC 14067]KIH73310.1 hypothetical protein SD36_09750 [Corynebacterium glutamicum]
MTFTIEQLEALKEGTTPGPWEATKHDILRAGWRGRLLEECPWYAEDEWEEEIAYMASDNEFVLSNPEPDYKPLTDNRADMELVASAPALLDQLITREAELQKLREEMALLASKVGVRATNAQTNGAFSSAVAFRETASAIIKILEETND